ncbi:uncharacterized protein L969DRAFT_93361 [Mixia osmundae IAM 14324]|uniref:Uncharacterized protein n=1 Tax=Mixia osmundae (strain CBS 9802 / IAM 14324 / JCM 22182 / KY 12970) TaxID=764103 RepID=G7E5A9_MIXOS|nr:uncharacterized protein L969DRAFT_93361 [Mixia osmundae IAM 14324]KEI40831.1 hypothetical protein L969DRAFT_93361 [Mixia osmundae IAM 14324]GAA98019.1 hypothetical protein E5Q_04699 [Mixia osmundae IAM 14324]
MQKLLRRRTDDDDAQAVRMMQARKSTQHGPLSPGAGLPAKPTHPMGQSPHSANSRKRLSKDRLAKQSAQALSQSLQASTSRQAHHARSQSSSVATSDQGPFLTFNKDGSIRSGGALPALPFQYEARHREFRARNGSQQVNGSSETLRSSQSGQRSQAQQGRHQRNLSSPAYAHARSDSSSKRRAEPPLPRFNGILPDANDFRTSLILPHMDKHFERLASQDGAPSIESLQMHLRQEVTAGRMTPNDECAILEQHMLRRISQAQPGQSSVLRPPPSSPSKPRLGHSRSSSLQNLDAHASPAASPRNSRQIAEQASLKSQARAVESIPESVHEAVTEAPTMPSPRQKSRSQDAPQLLKPAQGRGRIQSPIGSDNLTDESGTLDPARASMRQHLAPPLSSSSLPSPSSDVRTSPLDFDKSAPDGANQLTFDQRDDSFPKGTVFNTPERVLDAHGPYQGSAGLSPSDGKSSSRKGSEASTSSSYHNLNDASDGSPSAILQRRLSAEDDLEDLPHESMEELAAHQELLRLTLGLDAFDLELVQQELLRRTNSTASTVSRKTSADKPNRSSVKSARELGLGFHVSHEPAGLRRVTERPEDESEEISQFAESSRDLPETPQLYSSASTAASSRTPYLYDSSTSSNTSWDHSGGPDTPATPFTASAWGSGGFDASKGILTEIQNRHLKQTSVDVINLDLNMESPFKPPYEHARKMSEPVGVGAQDNRKRLHRATPSMMYGHVADEANAATTALKGFSSFSNSERGDREKTVRKSKSSKSLKGLHISHPSLIAASSAIEAVPIGEAQAAHALSRSQALEASSRVLQPAAILSASAPAPPRRLENGVEDASSPKKRNGSVSAAPSNLPASPSNIASPRDRPALVRLINKFSARREQLASQSPETQVMDARNTVVRRTIIVPQPDGRSSESSPEQPAIAHRGSSLQQTPSQPAVKSKGTLKKTPSQSKKPVPALADLSPEKHIAIEEEPSEDRRLLLQDRPATPPPARGHRRKTSGEHLGEAPLPSKALPRLSPIPDMPIRIPPASLDLSKAGGLDVPHTGLSIPKSPSALSVMSGASYAGSIYDMYADMDSPRLEATQTEEPDEIVVAQGRILPPGGRSPGYTHATLPMAAQQARLSALNAHANSRKSHRIEVDEMADGSMVWQVVQDLRNHSGRQSGQLDYLSHSRESSIDAADDPVPASPFSRTDRADFMRMQPKLASTGTEPLKVVVRKHRRNKSSAGGVLPYNKTHATHRSDESAMIIEAADGVVRDLLQDLTSSITEGSIDFYHAGTGAPVATY